MCIFVPTNRNHQPHLVACQRFLEGDAYHSEANVAKMHSGKPLTDDDRWSVHGALRKVFRSSMLESVAANVGSTCWRCVTVYVRTRTHACHLAIVCARVWACAVHAAALATNKSHMKGRGLLPSQRTCAKSSNLVQMSYSLAQH